MFWDAPLEQLANPLLTPNPAKAPWYFLGLQELLHFFPPFVAGVLIPTLVLMGLIVIPYFHVNVEGKPLWEKNAAKRFTIGGWGNDRAANPAGGGGCMDDYCADGFGRGAAGSFLLFESDSGLDVHAAAETAFVVGDDVVHRHGALLDRCGDIFSRPGLVLGVALGDACRLKRWANCRTACG